MTAPTMAAGIEVYAAFIDQIDNANTKRIVGGLATAMVSKVARIHLLFQSYGGIVGDGIMLYNFLNTLPIPLTLYNVGKVESIASVAFLGAKERKVSAHANFMIHRTINSPQRATAENLKVIAESLTLDDQRTEAILRKHLTLSEDQWTQLSHFDLTLSATDALKCGLATEIAEWAPPAGTSILTV